ncbi:MAG TPA: hypothetical protein VHL31_26325 [Geminicoccus sp.]|jgi:hypothetical protein|uniref:hypothetical protein n=1 Tax=Geminicoccus sp. TaxID=2024832 RepID=UPI002E2EE249|nr:hypothetical protein [Geminicoccus sp.]HEX2529794.1 hypothetical protein [Geminicoccus sp.]
MEFLRAWLLRSQVELRRASPAKAPEFPGTTISRAATPAGQDILGRFLQHHPADVIVLDRHRRGQG